MLTLPQPLDSLGAACVALLVLAVALPGLAFGGVGSRGVREQSKESCSDEFHG